MLSRSARAAYLSAGTLVPCTPSLPTPVELHCEEELKGPKSVLHDLGKLSKFAKLTFASPTEALPAWKKEIKESEVRPQRSIFG